MSHSRKIERRPTPRRAALLSACLAALALTACQTVRVDAENAAALPSRFEDGAAAGQRQAAEDFANAPTVEWWKTLSNEDLRQIVEAATADNFSLQALEANVKAAEAASDMARRDLLPKIGAAGTGGYHNASVTNILKDFPHPLIQQLAGADKDKDQDGSHGLFVVDGAWDVDIFGKKRSDAAAAKSLALSEKDKLEGARHAVSYAAARQYHALAALAFKDEALRRAEKTVRESLRYAQGRYEEGRATRLDQAPLEQKLDEIKAGRSFVAARQTAAKNILLALMGKTQDDDGMLKRIEGSLKAAAQSAALWETGLSCADGPGLGEAQSCAATRPFALAAPFGLAPSSVLRARPDVSSKLNLAQAAAAQTASAKADLFPSFSLGFSGGGMKIDLEDFTKDLTSLASLFNVGVKLPIFTAGRIQANIRSKEAKLEAALKDLDGALVAALHEANSAYALLSAARSGESAAESRLNTAIRKNRNAQQYFKAGRIDYAERLKAQGEAIENAEAVIEANAKLADAKLKLYEALGGNVPDPDWRPASTAPGADPTPTSAQGGAGQAG